jgi:hypothetical protein
MQRSGAGSVVPSRQARIAEGIKALRDATRMLRGQGAGQRADANEQERGALFDLAALADRLSGYLDDQSADDWDEFWLTQHDVDMLRTHVVALSAAPRGLAAATVPALQTLTIDLSALAQTSH